jgi:hypothetical protein
MEGATTCQDGAVQKCVEGAWTTEQVCPVACEGAECVAACTEDVLQCNGNLSLQKCVGGVFVEDTVCDFLCSNGACSGVCSPDDTRCNPDAPNESQARGVGRQRGLQRRHVLRERKVRGVQARHVRLRDSGAAAV